MKVKENIPIGSLIITSRSRYGTVISNKIENGISKKLVRIGSKQHWINEDQLILANSVITFKVDYTYNYCDKIINTSEEIPIKKGTVLYDVNINFIEDSKKFVDIIYKIIYKKLNHDITITKVTIS